MDKIDQIFARYQASLAAYPEWVQGLLGGSTVSDFFINNSLQTAALAFLGWSLATFLERRHNNQMSKREKLLADIKISTRKTAPKNAKDGILIYGSVVVAHDYFRTFFIMFRKLIGGNIKAYERLVARGRREAYIRMREDARLRGFDHVINVRFTGSHVAGRFLSAVEMVAYGTGVKSGQQSRQP